MKTKTKINLELTLKEYDILHTILNEVSEKFLEDIGATYPIEEMNDTIEAFVWAQKIEKD